MINIIFEAYRTEQLSSYKMYCMVVVAQSKLYIFFIAFTYWMMMHSYYKAVLFQLTQNDEEFFKAATKNPFFTL